MRGGTIDRGRERVLDRLTTALIGPVPILRFAERSAILAATIAGDFQVKRLANAIHHAKRLVSRK